MANQVPAKPYEGGDDFFSIRLLQFSIHSFTTVIARLCIQRNEGLKIMGKYNEYFYNIRQYISILLRQDSEYWKDITNKSFLSVQKSNDIGKNIAVRYHADSNGVGVYNSIFGMHYLSTGFNYYSVTGSNLDYMKNTEEIKYDFLIQENNQRDKLVERWNEIAKKQPTLLQYLKDNIHGDK